MIIRPALSSDADAVVALLHGKMDAKIAPERWRRLFTYEWLKDKPDFGRVAIVSGEVVGFVGAIHSDRMIAGGRERMVNICAWYLDRRHRSGGAGLRLMAEATADRDLHYLINTTSTRATEILKLVGFRPFDTERFEWRRRARPPGDVTVELNRDAIFDGINDGQRRLLRDHVDMPVTPALFSTPSGSVLIVFSVVRKKDRPAYDILHAADRVLLAEHGQSFADLILPSGDAVMAADARFCDGTPAHAQPVALPAPRFLKSAKRIGQHVDHLYTELQLLGLKLD